MHSQQIAHKPHLRDEVRRNAASDGLQRAREHGRQRQQLVGDVQAVVVVQRRQLRHLRQDKFAVENPSIGKACCNVNETSIPLTWNGLLGAPGTPLLGCPDS